MHQIQAAQVDPHGAQIDLSAEIHAALALSRATLHALAALSEAAQTAVEAALEEAADRAPAHARGLVEDARDQLLRAPAEAQMTLSLRKALVAAAEALPAARKVA